MGITLLSNMNFQIPLTTMLLVVIFSILTAVSLVHGLILRYHWNNYGNGAVELVFVKLVYVIGLSVLMGGMALFTVLYSISASI